MIRLEPAQHPHMSVTWPGRGPKAPRAQRALWLTRGSGELAFVGARLARGIDEKGGPTPGDRNSAGRPSWAIIVAAGSKG